MILLSAPIADTPENEKLINARHDVVASLAAMSLLGHFLPRRQHTGAAAIAPITDTEARGRRGRDGPLSDIR